MDDIARFGGFLFFLTFCHFLADWIPQSHEAATKKSSHMGVRAIHVTVYTGLMLSPLSLVLLKHPYWHLWVSLGVTWVTHFIGDTYALVFLWAKYIRKIPPELQTPKEPLTLILAIVIDQLWHILWLCVPVALSVWG